MASRGEELSDPVQDAPVHHDPVLGARVASETAGERALAGPPLLAACRRLPARRTPIWIMRQAGRYLPEYRKLRQSHGFLDLVKTPELAAEVTLMPIRRFDLDAAILFSDIMTPVESLGFELSFAPGPVIANPIRAAADLVRLPAPSGPRILEGSVSFVFEAIARVREQLPSEVPLIGFAGAPFTLFCYLVEGSASKDFARARALLYREPETARALLERLAELTHDYLAAQARAGAQVLMLFDSWAGLLSEDLYRRFALPAVKASLAGLDREKTPLIYFPHQGSALLEAVREVEVDVVGVDWRTSLRRARSILGPRRALQGNLDPAALFAPERELRAAIDRVLDDAGDDPGFVFNLGHGIDRRTPQEAVEILVEHVHARSRR